MGEDLDSGKRLRARIGFSLVFALAVGLVPIRGAPAVAADLLGPEGEAPVPPPPPPPVPVRPPPPLVAAEPQCLIVPQPQSDISGQDVIRFRPTRVCFSRGLLADRLPPPPPLVRPWWRFLW